MLYTVVLTLADDRKNKEEISLSFSGSLIFRQANFPDISYGIVCLEPFQKVPKISIYSNDDLVFQIEKEITPKYLETLSPWHRLLIIPYIKKINEGALYCKKSKEGFFTTEEQISFDEHAEKILVS